MQLKIASEKFLLLTPICAIATLILYLFRMDCGPLEFARLIMGCAMLWLPIFVPLFVVLRNEIPESVPRATISLIASYALTTMIYYGLSVLHLTHPVVLAMMTIVLWGATFRYARTHVQTAFRWRWATAKNFDWMLALLIAASLYTTVSFKDPYEKDPDTGESVYTLSRDHMYHAGQAYELARGIPPQQSSVRGGSPARAYHNFSHTTTMLIARATGQSDMLRVHLFYHYTVIEILVCLALFSLLSLITSSRAGGYIAVAIMYLTAFEGLAWPLFSEAKWFYFTVFPHYSSGLKPVMANSPQMYSSLVVSYGILLAFLGISIRVYRNAQHTILLLLTALIVAASIRFRIHLFLVALPTFLLMMGYLYFRLRKVIYVMAGATALAISLLLFLEMKMPVYQDGSTDLRFGYNTLTTTTGFVNSWPGADEVKMLVKLALNDGIVRDWTWHVISICAFVTLNIVGIPLAASTIVYSMTAQARREQHLFTFAALCQLFGTVLGGMVLASDFDDYSIPGQLLFHTRWYLFPFGAVLIYLAYVRFGVRLSFSRYACVVLGTIAITGAALVPRSQTEGLFPSVGFSGDEWAALQFLHDDIDGKTVLITNKHLNHFAMGGLTGKAMFLELPGNPINVRAQELDPLDNRRAVIRRLWSAGEVREFCSILRSTPATHLVEFADEPLHVDATNCGCLQPVYVSPNAEVAVYRVQ